MANPEEIITKTSFMGGEDKWQVTNLVNPNLSSIKKGLEILDKGLGAVVSAIDALSSAINLLQLFISAFSSLMAVLEAFISYVEGQLRSISETLANAGVFVNVIVPPAFYKNLQNASEYAQLSSGGFNAFVQRLKASLYNTADANRPIFSESGYVGGILFVSDSESLEDFFKAANFFVGMFSFMSLIPINLEPPPPRSVKTSSGYFKQPDGTTKFGIRIEWNAPPITGFPVYRISRSLDSKGDVKEEGVFPNKLVGPKGHPEQGLLTAIPILIGGGKLAKIKTIVYTDPPDDMTPGGYVKFNKGSPAVVAANPLNYSGYYIDYDINPDYATTYYYAVQSGFGVSWGPYSNVAEAVSIPKNCIPDSLAGGAAPNVSASGIYKIELSRSGVGALGQWSSVQVKVLLPFIPPIVSMLTGFLDALKGSLKTNTKSFVDFINGIVAKFKSYQTMLDAIIVMITSIENFFSGVPKIAMLTMNPEAGGVNNFINRVINAQRPSGGFTGPKGITLGVVIVYGHSLNNPAQEAAFSSAGWEAQMAVITAAGNLLKKLFTQ